MRGLVLAAALAPWVASPSIAATVTVDGRDSAAIATAIERSQPGDQVHLPVGTYAISEAVRPRSGTKLVGDGEDATVLRFAGDEDTVLVDLSGCADVTVSQLTLDGASSPHVLQGIYAHAAERLAVERVTIRDLVKGVGLGPHGIHFSGDAPGRTNGVTDSIIVRCTMTNIGVDSAWGAGVRLSWGSSRNQVLDCTIRDTGRGGVLADNGSTELLIQRNTISGSGGERLGIEVWGGCDRCVIEDNHIDHWLSVGGCDWCAVRRNTIAAADGSSAFIGIEAIGSHLVITGNTVDGGQIIGLSLSGPDPKQWMYFGDNDFRRCSQWGAQLQGEAGGISYIHLYRSRFVETTVNQGQVPYPGDEGHGFRINGNTHHMVLEECEITNNGRLGIQSTQPTPDWWSFVRCRITGNQGAAVSAPPAQEALEWISCVVEGNASDALTDAKPFAAAAPTATLEAPAEALLGRPFRLAVTLADGTAPMEVLWDMDDGPPVRGAGVEHTYTARGTYAVTAVVWDQNGRSVRATAEIRVADTGSGGEGR